MKNKILIILSLVFCCPAVHSQEKSFDPKIEKRIILLTNKKKTSKVKFIKDNKKIVYKVRGDEKKKKGRLHIINDSVITIDSQEVNVNNLSMIGGRSVGLKTAKIVGGTIMAAGVTLGTIGVILYFQSANKSGCESAFGQVIGVVMVAGGAAVIIVGSIPLAIKPKQFNLVDKWTVSIGHTE